ncbi:MAG: DNA repair protein RecO [Gammaproteobacteria bacterium]|nr:DNA repair protein RecO [Gammaproteobacteria bacterium]
MSALERVALARSYVLHSRPWRETSELLDVFAGDHGRLSVLARGMRRPKTGLRAILQPFQPLSLSWSGRGGTLLSLRGAEAAGSAQPLAGNALMSGFYANELLLRFLHRADPHPALFSAYESLLATLACEPAEPEPALRRFEVRLLAETGYGLNLDHDASSGERLDPARSYVYVADRGPVPAAGEAELTFSGEQLLAIGRGCFSDPLCLRAARRLLRIVIDHHLDGKPLRTRQVFLAMRR